MLSLAGKVGLTGVMFLIIFLSLSALFGAIYGEDSKAFRVAATGMIISASVIVVDLIFYALVLIWTKL